MTDSWINGKKEGVKDDCLDHYFDRLFIVIILFIIVYFYSYNFYYLYLNNPDNNDYKLKRVGGCLFDLSQTHK